MKTIRKLQIVGKYSYAITIPHWLIEELRWKKHQKLELIKKGSQIIVKDWKKKKKRKKS